MSNRRRRAAPITGPDPDWSEGAGRCELFGPAQHHTPPCPEGNPQRVCELLGFRLKGPDYLQLRVIKWPEDEFMCHVVLDERSDRVIVRLVACYSGAELDSSVCAGRADDAYNCPCNLWLDAPLGDRVVIDLDSGEELPLCILGRGIDEPTRYMPRPPGNLWHPDEPETRG